MTTDLADETVHPAHTVELGIWLGILTVDLELSDYGVALRWLAARSADHEQSTCDGDGIDEFLLWLLLRQDTLTLALLQEWSEPASTGTPRVDAAIDRLLADARAAADPDQLVPAMRLSEYLDDLESEPGRIERALAARLEILGAMGMVHRSDEVASRVIPDSRLESLISELQGRPLTREGAGSFLDQKFFAGLAGRSSPGATDPDTADRTLLRLVQSYLAIQRPLGFTPGRPISLLACCSALQAGAVMEIRDAYDIIYAAAESRWSKYLHFSGGSRFDREFLIRMDPALDQHLRKKIGTALLSR